MSESDRSLRQEAEPAGHERAKEYRWCVEDAATGMPVAQGIAPTSEEATRESARYAFQYAQDGAVLWWVRQGRKTVLKGQLEGVTITMTPGSSRSAGTDEQGGS